MSIIENSWRSRGLIACLLLPVSWFYVTLLAIRRWAYKRGWKASIPVPLPVVVVGNLSVGGTGKTPLCGYLVERYAKEGWRPAIVSRGYGGTPHETPHLVTEFDSPSVVGDEPILLFEQTGVPVCVCINRALAVLHIAEKTNANIVFSDDGLQHLSMPRVAEVLVVDGQRGFGNGWVLPAGPLRDSFDSLQNIDIVAVQMPTTINSDYSQAGALKQLHHSIQDATSNYDQANAADRVFSLEPLEAVELTTGRTLAVGEFSGQRVHAVAGIGHPQRFFDSLSQQDIDVIPHPKVDHAEFSLADIQFEDGFPVLVTVKDAVKLKKLDKLPDNLYQINTRVLVSDALDVAIGNLGKRLSPVVE